MVCSLTVVTSSAQQNSSASHSSPSSSLPLAESFAQSATSVYESLRARAQLLATKEEVLFVKVKGESREMNSRGRGP